MIKLDVGKDIYTVLSSNSAITQTIFPVQYEEDAPMPYVTYERTNTNYVRTKDFIKTKEHTIDLRIYTETYNEGISLAEEAVNTLLDYDYSSTDIKSVELVTTSEDWNVCYIQNITILIQYK